MDNHYSKGDKALSNFIVCYFFIQAINLFIGIKIGSVGWWNILSRGILVILLLRSIKYIIKRGVFGAVFAEIVFLLLFSFTLVSGGADFGTYSGLMINAVTVYLPMGIVVGNIRDRSILCKQLYIVSWPTSIVLIVLMLDLHKGYYSMAGGYALVFQTLIILDHYLKNKKFYDVLIVIVEIIVILISGSRGPLVCVATMIVVYITKSNQLSRTKKTGLLLVAATGALLVFVFSSQIMSVISSIARTNGQLSRTAYMYNSSSILDDSNRNAVYSFFWEKVLERPILGYGLVGGWKTTGYYPHNLFLESLVSFGLIGGIIVSVMFIVLIYKALSSKDYYDQRLSFIFFSYCISLLFSDSFVLCPIFYMLISIGISNSKIRIVFGNRSKPVIKKGDL